MKRTYMVLLICLTSVGLNATIARPIGAQQPSLSQRDVVDIADALLSAITRPSDSLSRVTIANRKIVFDVDRTLNSFGLPNAESESQNLKMHNSVLHGSKAVLDDCDIWGARNCASLGWKAYVWLTPLSVSPDSAIVRFHIKWPDRGRTTFAAGSSPIGKASLVGYATDVRLSRSSGTWRVVERIRSLAQ